MRVKKVKKEKKNALIKNGGMAESSLQKRKSTLGVFSRYILATRSKSLEDVIADLKVDDLVPDNADVSELQDSLVDFFGGMELNNGELPTLATMSSYRSNIKMHLLGQTGEKINIMNKSKFPEFTVSNCSQQYYLIKEISFFIISKSLFVDFTCSIKVFKSIFYSFIHRASTED